MCLGVGWVGDGWAGARYLNREVHVRARACTHPFNGDLSMGRSKGPSSSDL
jgi:hypothetical protein